MLTSSTTPPRLDYAILEKVAHYEDLYHLEDSFARTIECESGFDPSIQSGYFDKKGRQEQSFGIAQINLDANPSITKAEALDPDFALNYMAAQFAAGRQNLWSCWRIIHSQTNATVVE